MKNAFSRLKEKFLGSDDESDLDVSEEQYLEINPNESPDGAKRKVMVRPFVIKEFQDIKATLESLREGRTICLVNIKPLKDQDIVELKRAVNKIKKTCDAIEGDIAGFGEDWLVATPSFAQVHRAAAPRDFPASAQAKTNIIEDDKDF